MQLLELPNRYSLSNISRSEDIIKEFLKFRQFEDTELPKYIRQECGKRSLALLWEPRNLDDRIANSTFFKTTNEIENPRDLTCFEQNVHFYMTLKHMSPETNPTLLAYTMENVNLHAAVTFEQENELYYADPVTQVIGPCAIEPHKITVSPNLVTEEADTKEITFDDLYTVDDPTLSEMITQLRQPTGIINYLLNSGQRVSKMDDGMYDVSLFMHIDAEYNIHGQIRYEDKYYSNIPDNAMIYLFHNSSLNKTHVNTFQYGRSFWQSTHGKKLLENNTGKIPKHMKTAKDVAHFLQQHKFAFTNDTSHYERLQELKDDDLRTDVKKARKVTPEFFNTYLDFLRFTEGEKYGEPTDFGEYILKKLDKLTTMLENESQDSSNKTDADEQEEEEEDKTFAEIEQRNAFQFMRLAYDYTRYVTEIKTQLNA